MLLAISLIGGLVGILAGNAMDQAFGNGASRATPTPPERQPVCWCCNGTGVFPGTGEKCRACGGTGTHRKDGPA